MCLMAEQKLFLIALALFERSNQWFHIGQNLNRAFTEALRMSQSRASNILWYYINNIPSVTGKTGGEFDLALS